VGNKKEKKKEKPSWLHIIEKLLLHTIEHWVRSHCVMTV